MHAVAAIPFTTPDGVERKLRSTRGAKALIRERFGNKDIVSILNEHGEEAMFEIAYFMMYDEAGEPPTGLTAKKLLFATPTTNEATASVMAAIMAAVSQGKAEKNELETLMLAHLNGAVEMEMNRLTTSISGPSASSVSASQTSSTGGDTATPKLKRVSSAGSKAKSGQTIELV